MWPANLARFFSKTTGARDDPAPAQQPTSAASCLGNLLTEPDAWQLAEGFHHPDWQEIRTLIEQRATTGPERRSAWHDASLQWLSRLKTELGGDYRLGESQHYLLVMAKSDVSCRFFLGQCESALTHLRARLGAAAWHWKYGKHVVLLFEDEEAYDRYISHFYPGDEPYGASAGACLRGRGYVHTVLAPHEKILSTLVHELTHLCLTTQQLPTWLEEGLASHFARELIGHGGRIIDKESIIKQRAYWDRQNIQRFWSGESFCPGEEETLSYALAEHLVSLLAREFRDLAPFICAARWKDAGQAAARRHLGLELGDIAAAFLGEGDWRPRFTETPGENHQTDP